MVSLWTKLLQSLHPTSTVAFPAFDGSPHPAHLERIIERAARRLGHDLPRTTAFRKELEIRNKRLEGPTKEAVSRSISHSQQTAALYYQAPSASDSIATYKAIQSLIAGREGQSPGHEQERAGSAQRQEMERERGRSETVSPEHSGRKRRSVSDSGRAIQSLVAGLEGQSPGHEQEMAGGAQSL
jgi:hypothetical protein